MQDFILTALPFVAAGIAIAALVQRAINEGNLELDTSIDNYLPLDGQGSYPTVRQFLTHTSGCKAYYFESPMLWNRLKGRNDFFGIGDSMVLERVNKVKLAEQDYPFLYSNFGYAVLGLVLENVYQTEFTTLMNEYLTDSLGLDGTKISNGFGDLGNYWDWEPGDTYLSAGGITSNMEDMLACAVVILSNLPPDEKIPATVMGVKLLKELASPDW